MHRIAARIIIILSVAVFAAALVYPPVAALCRPVPDGGASAAIRTTAHPSLWLLARSSALAAGATILALVLALPGAFVIGRTLYGPMRRLRLAVALTVLPLLFPPMVYGFGWDRVMGGRVGYLLCVWVWASWAWPIPALVLGGVWARSGQDAYHEALTVTGPLRAMAWIALPALRAPAGICGLILFAFFLGDYSVPHSCGLMVTATDLLAIAESGARTAALFSASAGVSVVILAALGAAVAVAWTTPPTRYDRSQTVRSTDRRLPWITVVIVLATMGPPVWRLTRNVAMAGAIRRAVETYGMELIGSLLIALAAGVVSVIMGMGVVAWRRAWRGAAFWSLVAAALPGALVGQCLISGYLPIGLLYDHWPIMVLAYVARFGWIGVLAAWMVRSAADREQMQAARMDGADEPAVLWQVGYRAHWPVLLAAVSVVTSLSVAEVATTSMVRVPGVTPVSLLLVEKFHRFEDDMLVALSFVPMLTALPAVVMGVMAAGQWSSRRVVAQRR